MSIEKLLEYFEPVELCDLQNQENARRMNEACKLPTPIMGLNYGAPAQIPVPVPTLPRKAKRKGSR